MYIIFFLTFFYEFNPKTVWLFLVTIMKDKIFEQELPKIICYKPW